MAELNINDFIYDLPAERIALYPLAERDQSKLLFYHSGKIEHTRFYTLADHLPENSFLFFNDTKVIPARLQFKKETGAEIEIFLLNPLQPSSLLVEAMHATTTCVWKCTIGNLKRWTPGNVLKKNAHGIMLSATLINRQEGIVKFDWITVQSSPSTTSLSFAEIVRLSGETPLPPYLKREAEASDRERYQTIYSKYEGAVAAPTAGLHFTDKIFESLRHKGIRHDFLTLHVSAGTFQPIKTEDAHQHVMHEEQIIVSRQNLKNLLMADRFIVPVGTTSMRTLESLYWFGVKLLTERNAEFNITQYDPYRRHDDLPSKETSLRKVEDYMFQKQTDMLIGSTSIFIRPGYTFRVCQGLITNFHQPASTLILLVAAFTGNDWKKIYNEALHNDYRFLSYGDSSLLIP
ncbi:MAG: S-adenosylmethionine:tRNA ribosyltransferase-isomerase [Bacteroidota bacterium]